VAGRSVGERRERRALWNLETLTFVPVYFRGAIPFAEIPLAEKRRRADRQKPPVAAMRAWIRAH